MLEDPDAGRLLLLRVWLTGPHHGPRQEVRHYRPPDDTRYTVVILVALKLRFLLSLNNIYLYDIDWECHVIFNIVNTLNDNLKLILSWMYI